MKCIIKTYQNSSELKGRRVTDINTATTNVKVTAQPQGFFAASIFCQSLLKVQLNYPPVPRNDK